MPIRRSKTVDVLITLLLTAQGCTALNGDPGDGPEGTPLGGPEPMAYAPEPEPPAILRDVAMIDDEGRWTNPHVPGLRTTLDGRLALRVQGAGGVANFYLHAPERVDEPLVTAPAGIQLLADTSPFLARLPQADFSDSKDGHTTICEAPPGTAGERPNPYACGDDLRHDCYDITVISSKMVSQFSAQLFGTPVTVEVASPKTAEARIVRADVGEAVKGTLIPFMDDWTEPAVTNDGRLLTGRLGGVNRWWTNPNTGEELLGSYDLAYSLLPEDAEPCDVTGWTAFHPMSHAPYDPAMQRYGLAAYPFRDTEGRPIADGDDLAGSYPWVDREGNNVFMTAVPGTITEQSHEDFPRRCVVEGCEDHVYPKNWNRGFMVAGLWTHGKFVHIDARINNVDWSVGMRPELQMMVDLYHDTEGQAVPVRFGSGRDGNLDAEAFPANQNILDSFQQLHNHRPAARTVTPRDVVWVMSTGVATDEVVFDDFLDPRALIVSNMQASVTPIYDEGGRSSGVPHHHTGQRRSLGPNVGGAGARTYAFDAVNPYEDVHLQNAATPLDLAVPAFGLVEEGSGRVEPVALGGFYGRGFWLDGDNRIVYDIPAQEDPTAVEGDGYVGLFVDVRTDEGATRALLTFPDGTSVRLVDRETLQIVERERVLHEVALPATDAGWMHLGWRIHDDHRELTLLVDGFPFDHFVSDRRFFGIGKGTLLVGRGPDRASGKRDAGFRGWVDDFKVLAHDVDPEVACNHAGGTLVRLEGATLGGLADLYPDWAHAEIAAAAHSSESDRFACFHDYTWDNAANIRSIPDGAESLRDAILFPEGPLMAGAPRPDSSNNGFCLSCHTDGGQGGLGLDALEFRAGVLAENDPRRQPSQPPPRVFGNIPSGWIPAGLGPGSPAGAMVAPNEGVPIDRWLLPNAER